MSRIRATLFTDPACPWAYSEIPALRVLEWRYGDQLEWRLVVIGLRERPGSRPPIRSAIGQLDYRRYGMPLSRRPKARPTATARACRALVAARMTSPGSEWLALRALQLAQFTTDLLLDGDRRVAAVVAAATGLDAGGIEAMLDSDAVTAAYEHDRTEARGAAGSPAELQGKTAASDGAVRFTAPSVVFERNGLRLVAGGFQPVEAYDVLIANLDPALRRRGVPADPLELLAAFPEGLTTQEVAALMAEGNDAPDPTAAELALLDLLGEGRAVRTPAADGAVWSAPGGDGAGWYAAVAAAAGGEPTRWLQAESAQFDASSRGSRRGAPR